MWASRELWYELVVQGLVKDTLPCKYCGNYPLKKEVNVSFLKKLPLYVLKCNCKEHPSTEILSTLEHVSKEWNRNHA